MVWRMKNQADIVNRELRPLDAAALRHSTFERHYVKPLTPGSEPMKPITFTSFPDWRSLTIPATTMTRPHAAA
eukprot:4756980-Lingulodinium_polyedra.AAC.1